MDYRWHALVFAMGFLSFNSTFAEDVLCDVATVAPNFALIAPRSFTSAGKLNHGFGANEVALAKSGASFSIAKGYSSAEVDDVTIELITPRNAAVLNDASILVLQSPPNGVKVPKLDVQHIQPDILTQAEKPKIFFDASTKTTLGDLHFADPRVQQQSDPKVATDEVKQLEPLNLSSAETARLASSAQCQAAYNNLVMTFELNKESMGFWKDPGRSVADFIPWYYQSSLSQANRDKAKPVLQAQEKFSSACLEYDVPPEVNSALIQRAVGILMFGDKVFCTALRVSTDEVLTAKHCFLNLNTGSVSPDASAVLKGSGQMWFAYEAEATKRFGVCRSSLPSAIGKAVEPAKDSVRIRIAATKAPVAPMKWVTPPIKSGSSLYLRGYFPFTDKSTTALGRLRSTLVGGCFAHSGAGRCFFHACQTTPIMSGAPIFLRPEPGTNREYLELAGIHIGSALLADPNGVNGSVCPGIDGSKVPSSNFAYQP